MKKNIIKGLFLFIVGVIILSVGNGVSAAHAEWTDETKLGCTYNSGRFKIYYNQSTQIAFYVFGQNLGISQAPIHRAGLSIVKDVDSWNQLDNSKWHVFDENGDFTCPKHVYIEEKSCKHSTFTDYKCAYVVSPDLESAGKNANEYSQDVNRITYTNTCIYDNIVVLNYDKDDKGEYGFYLRYDDNCEEHRGTTDDPCVKKIKPKEKNTKAARNPEVIVGKYSEGKYQFNDGKGNFSCPVIWYRASVCTGDNTTPPVQCVYEIAPYDPADGNTWIRAESSINTTTQPKNDLSESELCTEEEINNAVVATTYDEADTFEKIKETAKKEYGELIAFFESGTMSETAYNYWISSGQYGLAAKTDGMNAKYLTRFRQIIAGLNCQTSDELLNKKLNELMDLFYKLYDEAGVALKAGIQKSDVLDEEQKEAFTEMVDEKVEEAKKRVDHYVDVIGSWYNKLLGLERIDDSCQGLLDKTLVEKINEILNWIRVIVPILVIVLSTIDFSKAVLVQDKDELKQATSKLVKRLIIAVAIFFVPTLLKLLVDAFNEISPYPITDLPDCGIK